jgi:putative ABC transport system permease protein
MLSDWTIRFRSLFERAVVEHELDDELRSHLERQAQSYENAGLSHDEAVRRARVEFGGLDQAKEDCRDARGTRWLEETIQDLRFAARLLTKDRWFTLAVLLVLTLGISVNNTVFTLVNAALIRDLPFEHAERIVSLGTHDIRNPAVHGPLGYRGLSYQEYEEWRGSATAFAGIAAYADATMNVSEDTRSPERLHGAYVSSNAFGLLGRQPLLGRDFRPEDDQHGAPPVMILGYRVWTSRYGADPAILGRPVRINGTSSIVVGVMPARFGFPLTAEVWQPLAQMPDLVDQPHDARILNGFGRLADRTTIAAAQSDLDSIADRLARQFPDTNTDVRSTVWTYADRYVAPQVRLILLALMGAVVFVLLIACANVANLLLARAAQRSHEISIRTSLGATRWRIVRQLLSESVLLGAAGGAAGYALSIAGVRLLGDVLDASNPPYWLQLTMDGRTFAYLTALCLGTGVLFGLAPALHTSRANASEALQEASRTGAGGRRVRRWTSALVIAEIALTLVLLAGAGFMMRSFFRSYRAHADIDTWQLLTMRLDLPLLKYRTPEQRIAFVHILEERLGGLDPVAAATIASNIPFDPAPLRELALDSRPTANGNRPPRVATVTIGGRFFDTLNMRLVRGRRFSDLDGMPGHETAIVNQRFAAVHFSNDDPIGHRIRVTNPNARGATAPWATVVGVSPTIRQDITTEGEPVVYLPYRAQPGSVMAVLVRTTSAAGAIVPLLREEVRALDPDLPLFDIKTLDERLAFSRWPERVFGIMFAIFACIGLVMAAVGLYAVTAYSVRQRTQEIGVRMALGATAPQVWWLVLRRVMGQLAIGLILGLPGAFFVGQLPWMGSADPLILMSIVLAVVIVAGVASFLPARRATELDPLRALRYE